MKKAKVLTEHHALRVESVHRLKLGSLFERSGRRLSHGLN